MANHVSPIRYYLTPFFMSEFCCTLSSIIMYASVPTVSACNTNEPLQATGQGQLCLLSYSDVIKAKGSGLPVLLESCPKMRGQKLGCFSSKVSKLLMP